MDSGLGQPGWLFGLKTKDLCAACRRISAVWPFNCAMGDGKRFCIFRLYRFDFKRVKVDSLRTFGFLSPVE
jgi:hypothetical protein